MRINEFPTELLQSFLVYLRPVDLARAARVSRTWLFVAENCFKILYKDYHLSPSHASTWMRAFSEKMRIVNHISDSRFTTQNFNQLSLFEKMGWIQSVKNDTVSPQSNFGDYFSYNELNSINIEGHDFFILDSDRKGCLVYVSALLIYYYTGDKRAIYAPLQHYFRARFKAIILGIDDFIIPTLSENREIHVYRYLNLMWTRLFTLPPTPYFRILNYQQQFAIQISARCIQLFQIQFDEPRFVLNHEEDIDFFKIQYGVLYTFSGNSHLKAWDMLTGKQIIGSRYLVRTPRFFSECKFTQVLNRNSIGYISNQRGSHTINLPKTAKIIKAIWAECLIFFCYSFGGKFYIDAFDPEKNTNIDLPQIHSLRNPVFSFNLPINLYYSGGILLCHSRLFEVATLFDFRNKS